MAAPPQQQATPGDHHYFEWSSNKQPKLVPIGVNQQQTNLTPLMTHTNRRQYYQHYEEKRLLEDKKLKQNITSSNNGQMKKRQKTNGIGSSSTKTNDDQNQSQQTCYPFQAELTQKIDIECGNNSNGQLAHTPTHHFTLSTVINVSVNGQTPQSLDILPSPSQQQQCPEQDSSIPLIPYSDLNLSIYLKDIDLTTFDTFILPVCSNSEDYLTLDGLLTFLMADKSIEFNKRYQQQLTSRQYQDTYRMQQMYNHPRTQPYRYPLMVSSNPYSFHTQQYPMTQHCNHPQPMPQQNSSSMIMTGSCASSSPVQQSSIITETGNIYPSSYYRQSALPQPQLPRQISSSSSPALPFR